MTSTKKTPSKGTKSASKAHYQRGSTPPPAMTPPTPTPNRRGGGGGRDRDVGSSDGGSASKRKSKSAEKAWNYTHHLPNPDQKKKNGRMEGRNLITWTRPRMAEKLLLHIQYECTRYKIDIPWDSIAHRLHPGSSGGAIQQHLNRLRANLIAEGHLVPPICQKPGSRVFVDSTIRGYVRKYPESDDFTTTRPVKFDEPMDDRRFNLPDAYENFKPMNASRREYAEQEGYKYEASPSRGGSVGGSVGGHSRGGSRTPAKNNNNNNKSRGRSAARSRTVIKQESPDPADLSSDASYDPKAKATSKHVRRSVRATAKPARSYIEDDDNNDEPYSDDEQHNGHADEDHHHHAGYDNEDEGQEMQQSLEFEDHDHSDGYETDEPAEDEADLTDGEVVEEDDEHADDRHAPPANGEEESETVAVTQTPVRNGNGREAPAMYVTPQQSQASRQTPVATDGSPNTTAGVSITQHHYGTPVSGAGLHPAYLAGYPATQSYNATNYAMYPFSSPTSFHTNIAAAYQGLFNGVDVYGYAGLENASDPFSDQIDLFDDESP
ncbi:hypothetical protein QBC46DRAFT_348892 [Diplogelasinospora grovesii]|uniref:Uncharacterized protein n=1 Tax=Diplogelasinospora grovesii TaxID=303347 RepID=A0AAN6NI88_9PEZI|nr:hypothetical protein QBC46DRAFT_348892 [Diplogelasinospora grovesii]